MIANLVVLATTALLISLHAPDDTDVMVNIDEVISLRNPKTAGDKHFAKNVNCMINTTDGKFVTVKETCKDVMRIFVDTERAP